MFTANSNVTTILPTTYNYVIQLPSKTHAIKLYISFIPRRKRDALVSFSEQHGHLQARHVAVSDGDIPKRNGKRWFSPKNHKK